MKNELVAGCTGGAFELQLAKAALHVFALVVKYADSRIAAARLALTSQGTQKLEPTLPPSFLRVAYLYIFKEAYPHKLPCVETYFYQSF